MPLPAFRSVRSYLTTGVCVSLVGLAGIAAGPSFAQDTGGLVWRFGISQGIETESNPGLASPSAPRETNARTGLSFSVESATRSQSLSLSGSGSLAFGDEVRDDGFQDPSLTLNYSRQNASARLATRLFMRETDVDALAFDLGLDPLGTPIIVTTPDIGIQRQAGGSVSLTLGRDAPFGATLGVNFRDTTYRDTTDPSLVDSTRTGASVGLRFDVSEAMSLGVDLSTSRLDEDGAAAISETNSISVRLTNNRPDGALSFTLGATDTTSGTRTRFGVSRDFAVARGTLSVRAGIDRSAFGETGFNGGLTWEEETDSGNRSVSLSHGLTQNAQDDEQRNTSLSIGLSEQLMPRLRGSLNIGLRDSEATQTGISTTTTSVTARANYTLTPDWGVGLSATHRIQERDGDPKVDNTLFSLSVSRNFVFRP